MEQARAEALRAVTEAPTREQLCADHCNAPAKDDRDRLVMTSAARLAELFSVSVGSAKLCKATALGGGRIG